MRYDFVNQASLQLVCQVYNAIMVPQTVGRYEIKEKLGRGGMASVYRARDPRFNRDVAIKILPRELTLDPQFRARFDREAQTIAALEHPAIVPVHDYGEEEGQPFLVMRLMQGASLAERLEDGPLPFEDVSKIIARIGSALDRAHEAGVIHRDLKPGNILFDQYGDAYLADFGIARLADSSATLTGTGLVGTPAYMSPEQIEGKELDGRTDIYALGIIVFEMLTGERPYQADTPAMLLVKQMTEPMPRVLDVKPDLPSGCEDVITRATAKQPDARYDKASQLADTLTTALREEQRAVLAPTQPRETVSVPPKAPPEPAPTPLDIDPLEPEPTPTPTKDDAVEPEPKPPKRRVLRWVLAAAGILLLCCVGALIISALIEEAEPDPAEEGLAATADTEVIDNLNIQNMVQQNRLGRGTVETAVLSPDMQSVAVGGTAGIWIYDAHTLELKQQLEGHTDVVWALAWSPNSRELASGSWDQTVRLWDVNRGEQVGEISHEDQLIALAWSANGTTLASATWSSQILLWDVPSGNSLGELRGHRDSITHLAFAPNGPLLASASQDSARLWQVDREEEVALLTDVPSERGNLHWSANGERMLLTSLDESSVRVWDANGREQIVLSDMEFGVYDAAWSPDGMQILTTSGDGTVRLWDSRNGQQLRLLPDFENVPLRLIWLADKNELLLVLDNGVLAVVDAEGREIVALMEAHTAVSGPVAFSPNGTMLATGHKDGSVRLWQEGDAEPIIFAGHGYHVAAVSWSPDGGMIASTGGDYTVRLWNIEEEVEEAGWEHPEGEISTIAWSPNEPWVAVADLEGHIWLWDVEEDEIVMEWQAHNDAVSRLAWSPEGTELASSGWDGVVHVWEIEPESNLLFTLEHEEVVRDVAWSPDGSQLASVAHDFIVRVWELEEEELIWQEAHEELATAVAWSPDGRCLATGSWDLTIIIWDAESGENLVQLEGHIGPITSLDWSPDGRSLISGSDDGTAILWRVP